MNSQSTQSAEMFGSDAVARAARADALTSGFQRALFASSIFLVAAAVIALRATNTRGEAAAPAPAPALGAIPDPAVP